MNSQLWSSGRRAAWVMSLCCLASSAFAQRLEDHSLPRSAIKTWHVKCPNGRLAMIRYDTRADPVRVCVMVQDGSRPQACVMASQQTAQLQAQAMGVSVCQSN